MPRRIYTVPELRRKALLLLVALGLDGAIFGGALALGHFGPQIPEIVSWTCFAALILSSVAGLALTMLLVMSLIALGLLSWAHRRRES